MERSKLPGKVLYFAGILLFIGLPLFGADRYSVTSGNWNSPLTWSATSGGVPGASVPVAGDVVFIENGNTITVTSNAACLSVTFTGLSGTMVVNSTFTLSVSGSVTLVNQQDVSSGCIINGAGIISCADIVVGNTSNIISGNGNIFTHTLTTDIASLNVSNNITINCFYTGGSVKDARNGVFNLSSGIVTVSGSITTIAESNKNEATFSMATGLNSGTLILNGSDPFNIDRQASVINLNGTSTLVIYGRAGAQNLLNTDYRNIVLSGSGAKNSTGPGTVHTTGILSMEGTATFTGKAATYGPNATLQYKGSAAQITGVEFPAVFSGSGGVIIDNINGITLNAVRTISIQLIFINGKIATGINTLILAEAATVSGAGPGKYIFGNLQKGIATGTLNKSFEIGDALAYTPVSLSFTGAINVAGSITAYTTPGDHPNISISVFNPSYTVNRYWTLVNNGVSGFTSYSPTFTFVAGDLDAGVDYNLVAIGNYNLSLWSYPSVGIRTPTSTQATGLTTFGDFQIGSFLLNYRSLTSGNWELPGTWEVLSGASWIPAPVAPSAASGTINIRVPHIVTINNSTTIDQLTVDAGGDLKIISNVVVADGPGTDVIIYGTIECTGAAALTGPGSFLLSGPATLMIGSPDGISVSGSTGNIQTAVRTFDSNANYVYNGTISQITGNGLPSTLNNLTIINLSGVSLANSVTINGILALTSGIFSLNSNAITFQVSDIPITRSSGTISTTNNSGISFGTPGNTGGSAFTIPAGTFTSAPEIRNLTIYRTNSLTLNDQILSVNESVLCNGPLITNNNLTLLSTATKTAFINGSGNGQISGNATMQRYLSSGFGYKYFSSPFQASAVSEFGDDMNLGAAFPSFYRYDESRISSGWVSYIAPAGLLNPMQGYAINFGSSAAPNTADATGIFNNGNLSVTLNNHNNTYTKGFNLVGNPYPSPIDWDASAGWTKANIDNALYFFKASTTDQYGGTYSTYINGTSSDGLATAVVPSMQGFFVHVSDGAYPVTGTLGMTNSVRINDLAHSFLKSGSKSSSHLLRLSVRFADDSLSSDPYVIYTDEKASDNFDNILDALKLMNTDLKVPNIYGLSEDGAKLSINALQDSVVSTENIPLGLKLNRDGRVVFKVIDSDIPSLYNGIYLTDAVTNIETRLMDNAEYKVDLLSGEYLNRFFLNARSVITGIHETITDDYFSIYMANDKLNVIIRSLSGGTGTIRIYNLTGQILFTDRIYTPGHYEFDTHLMQGMYIVSLVTGKEFKSKKIYVNQ